jgi:hypothetical protein
MKTKLAFCAAEQTETEHEVTIDENGEFLFTCECGRFFKLSGDLDKDGIKEALVKHQEQNQGQLTVEAIEAANEEKLALLDEDEA